MTEQETKSRYIPMHQAMQILGISKVTMTRLVRDGTLQVRSNPLDKRVKLVLFSQVEALKKQAEEIG